MRKLFLLASLLLAVPLAACQTPLAAALGADTAAKTLTISRASLDFAFNSFDAALYGLDFAMDAKLITPGSPRAKELAALGRKVQGFLNAANTAYQAGNSPGYDSAFTQALAALAQFKQLLGPAPTASVGPVPRDQILARAAA